MKTHLDEEELEGFASQFIEKLHAEVADFEAKLADAEERDDEAGADEWSKRIERTTNEAAMVRRFVREMREEGVRLTLNSEGKIESTGFFAHDESGYEVEFPQAKSARDAAERYVSDGSWEAPRVAMVAYRKLYWFEILWPSTGKITLEREAGEPERVTVSVRVSGLVEAGTFALLLNPKTRELVRVVVEEEEVTLLFGDRAVGEGYLDATTEILDRDNDRECPRTHTPEGVPSGMSGRGYGLLIYCALALLAASTRNSSCVGSTVPRSPAANLWWERAVERGLAIDVSSSGDVLPVSNVLALGIVVYWSQSQEFEEEYEERRREMTDAYLLAQTADDQSEDLLRRELAALGVSARDIEGTRDTESEDELRANRSTKGIEWFRAKERLAAEQLSWAAEFAD